MADLNSEKIIGSCNAAGMQCLQDQAEYSGGVQWKLGGIRYFHDIRGITARRRWAVNR
jgi:hypothetical protein